jgi:hypothetical protein
MKNPLWSLAVILALGIPALANQSLISSSSGPFPVASVDACVDTSSACRQAIPAQPPAWEVELQKAQTAWGSCQKEVDQFCEGVQVGEGRIENCLKKHRAKLSRKCRQAQGLK